MFDKLSCVYVSFKVLVCIVVSWIVCRVIVVLCILWSPYVYSLSVYLWCCVFDGLGICCTVYLLYCVLCICCTVSIDVFPLDAGMLARGQYSEGPATGHLDTGFSWFPRVFANAELVPKTPKLPLHASHVALQT
jgi:hypothetical protein